MRIRISLCEGSAKVMKKISHAPPSRQYYSGPLSQLTGNNGRIWQRGMRQQRCQVLHLITSKSIAANSLEYNEKYTGGVLESDWHTQCASQFSMHL
jgi:hypothetical protein